MDGGAARSVTGASVTRGTGGNVGGGVGGRGVRVGLGVGGGVGAGRSRTTVVGGAVSVTERSAGWQRPSAKHNAVITMALGTATAKRLTGSSKAGAPTLVFMRRANDSCASRGSRSGEANAGACSSRL